MTLNEMSEKEKNEMLEMYQSLLDSQVPEWIVKDKVNDAIKKSSRTSRAFIPKTNPGLYLYKTL